MRENTTGDKPARALLCKYVALRYCLRLDPMGPWDWVMEEMWSTQQLHVPGNPVVVFVHPLIHLLIWGEQDVLVSCSPRWTPTHCVVKDDPEQVLLPPPPELGLEVGTTTLSVCSTMDF